MNNQNLTPAPIDEKNVYTDFIYDMFDGCGEFIEHIGKNKFHIVGYWNGRLIEVTWLRYTNTIAFAFVDLQDNKHTEEDEKKLIEFINDVDSQNTGVIVKVYRDNNWILSDWFFVE